MRALVIFSLLLLACDSASNASSATALLRVADAQIVPGAPAEDAQGPGVQGITVFETRIWPGQVQKPISGVLQPGATAAALYLFGDAVHYIVPAAAPDVTAPDQPTFAAQLSFSARLQSGPQALSVQAVDSAGIYGPASLQRLDAVADEDAMAPPEAPLQIVLRWDRPVDLDLHVEEPNGQVIWSRRKAGAASMGTGVLDIDSNEACIIDGRQREQVIYMQPPPRGRYRVRIDTFSLCDQATAYWFVEVFRSAQPFLLASGQSLPSDTRETHDAQAGVLALEFDIP